MAKAELKWKLLAVAVAEIKQHMHMKYEEVNGEIDDETFNNILEYCYNTLENVEKI